MKKYILIFLSILCIVQIQAQTVVRKSSNEKPLWTTQIPVGKSGSYAYFVGNSSNEMLDKAIAAALNNVIQQVNEDKGMTYQISVIDSTKMKNITTGQDVRTVDEFSSQAVITATGEPIDIKIKTIELYWEQLKNGNKTFYECAVLVRVPKTKADPDLPLFTTDKGGVWRSALYSGWGQMYNKHKAKGTMLLIAQTVTLAGIGTSQAMYAYNTNKATQSIGSNYLVYKANADSWAGVRNIFAIGAGAVYIYNLIDILGAAKPKLYSDRMKLYPTYAQNGFQLSITYSIR